VRASVSGITDELGSALMATHPPAPGARAAVLEARLYFAVIQGRFADARALAGEFSALDPDRRRPISWALHAYALTGQGRVDEALEIATSGMSVAHARLDLDALRVYGSAAVLAHIFVGDFDAVDRVLDTLLATGDSYTLPRGFQISVLNVAAIAALRRGDVAQAERYVDEISGLSSPDGPLPGQDTCWSRAHVLASAGHTQAAADAIWASSEDLWERGALFSAALGYVSSLELVLDSERLERAWSRVARVEGSFVHAAMAYIRALFEEDPDRVHAAAHMLQASGRIALAIAAYRAAIRLYGLADRPKEARTARQEVDALLVTDGGKWRDTPPTD
jgi:tetratricopeptide (TPR) repeat protein